MNSFPYKWTSLTGAASFDLILKPASNCGDDEGSIYTGANRAAMISALKARLDSTLGDDGCNPSGYKLTSLFQSALPQPFPVHVLCSCPHGDQAPCVSFDFFEHAKAAETGNGKNLFGLGLDH